MDTWAYDIGNWYPEEGSPYIGNGWIGGNIPLNGHGGEGNRHLAAMAANYMGRDETYRAVPHWLNVDIRFDGKPVKAWFFDFHKVLDLKIGVFLTEYLDGEKNVRVSCETFCHRGEAPLAAYRLVVKALKPGRVEVAPRLDATGCTGIEKTRTSAAEGAMGWELDFGDPQRRIAQELVLASVSGASAPAPFEAQGVLGQRLAAQLAPEGAIALDVLVSTCRGPDPLPDAHAVISRALQTGYDALKRSQAQAMQAIWDGFDVSAEDPFLERRLRGAMFYLTAGYRDDVVWGGTPSSLSSKINWGNCVFWDTEFYMFPPLLLAQPQIARNMMLYRHGLLDGARANARNSGARGARFGWQSHRDGSGHAGPFEDEIHITADIAYCAWWYAQSTGDVDFFNRFGREIVGEAARFFASRTVWNAAKSRAEIHGVIPPDEHVWDHYSGRVNNSAMTNGYAAWTMAKGAEAGEGFATPEERAEWHRLAKALWLPRDEQRDIFSEYEGYRGHAVKQADVGHLFFPLLVSADPGEIRRNVYYYADREKETGLYLLHSPSVYGAALSRAGDVAGVRRFLELSARNATGPFEVPRESNYGGGVCTTASGSFLTLALYGLLGIENQGDTLAAHPSLAEETGALSIAGLTFRGRRYRVAAKPGATAADIGTV